MVRSRIEGCRGSARPRHLGAPASANAACRYRYRCMACACRARRRAEGESAGLGIGRECERARTHRRLGACGVARCTRLVGLLPVVSMRQAYKIPLPALVSAHPYGTLCSPPLDHGMAVDAAATRMQAARQWRPRAGAARGHPRRRRDEGVQHRAARRRFAAARAAIGHLRASSGVRLVDGRGIAARCAGRQESSRNCAGSATGLPNMARSRLRWRARAKRSQPHSKPSWKLEASGWKGAARHRTC